MTMHDLDQYAAMREEVKEIREQIKRLEAGIVHDRVQGSMDEHPYTMRTVAVEGIPPKRATKTQELRNMLLAKEYELSAALWKIEAWMKSVKDSQVRRAIRMRVDGKAWTTVSLRVFGSANKSTAYMAVERCLKKSCEPCERLP